MSNAANFRKLLASKKMIVAPGAIDCITGRAIAQAGFSAVYMTGAGTSATLGYPDYGLITMSEMVGNASRIVNSIDIPLISDSDTGFGVTLVAPSWAEPALFALARRYEEIAPMPEAPALDTDGKPILTDALKASMSKELAVWQKAQAKR